MTEWAMMGRPLRRSPIFRDRPLNPFSATVPMALVNGFLASADHTAVERVAMQSGIPQELLHEPGARITQEQFSLLYRMLAKELDDEMPGIFSRPLRTGTLKFPCLSLLDAPRLQVALHRFSQFMHLLLDEFSFRARHDGDICCVELVASPDGPPLSVLGRVLMLKLVHGVASWLIGKKISLAEGDFDFIRPPRANDYLYLFPGPVRFGGTLTCMSFDAAYLDMGFRQQKSDLKMFLSRAPEDWIFVSFADTIVCHRVRQYVAGCLPVMPTVDVVSRVLHYSVRTLSRRLSAEGTTFQAIKDEVRPDIAPWICMQGYSSFSC
jgi:hypothetical protein